MGGGVIKQRIARPGRGKSGGFRSIILFRWSDRAFFVYGFAKNDKDHISQEELRAFKELAKVMLNCSEDALKLSVSRGALIEVKADESSENL